MRTFFDHPLQGYNTFGSVGTADIFIHIEKKEDVEVALAEHGLPTHILGGGSNVILPSHMKGVIWHPAIMGKDIAENGDEGLITIGAGEKRDGVVKYTVQQGLRGIENLVAIPGSAGAAPVQNIGAYGVELKDTFVSCDVYDLYEKQYKTFDLVTCRFGYRDSIFKQEADRYMILSITLRLSRIPKPVLIYEPVKSAFAEKEIQEPTQAQIAETIEEIRWSKLPRPEVLGNCGSFFKNPLVSKKATEALLKTYPAAPHFAQPDGSYKLSAAWLIDNAGLKGYRDNALGTYEKQPLVLVNYGGATGDEVISFSQYIINKVKSIFNVTLEREANIR